MTQLSPHVAQNHVVVADAFTAFASIAAVFGWFVGWLTPLMSLLVLFLGAAWYIIQITSSDWWKQRKHRRHHARARRLRRNLKTKSA